MGIIDKILKRRDEEPTEVVDNNERGASDPESSKPAEEPMVEEPKVEEQKVEEKPANSVLTPVTYNPASEKPKDLVHDPDSNEKAPGEKSFM